MWKKCFSTKHNLSCLTDLKSWRTDFHGAKSYQVTSLTYKIYQQMENLGVFVLGFITDISLDFHARSVDRLINWLIDWLIHSFIQSFSHSFIHSFNHPCIYPSIHSSIHSLIIFIVMSHWAKQWNYSNISKNILLSMRTHGNTAIILKGSNMLNPSHAC